MNTPKIVVVTPAYNSEEFIEKTILSVKGQNYENYEHIIVDGGSTDGTLDIIKKYDGTYPMRWISEPDNGMYSAINKGFKMADGDIYAWLNSDDMYVPWTFQAVAQAMSDKKVQWCGGRNAYVDKSGVLYLPKSKLPARAVPRMWIEKGYCDNRIYGFIQQESSFWTADLWNKVGGLDENYKLAGDYDLWRKFAKYEERYSINTVLAGFRIHDGQLSGNISKYYSELPKLGFWGKLMQKTRLPRIYMVICNPAKKNMVYLPKK